MQLAPPRTPRALNAARPRRRPGSRSARSTSLRRVRTLLRIPRIQLLPGAVTVNITTSRSGFGSRTAYAACPAPRSARTPDTAASYSDAPSRDWPTAAWTAMPEPMIARLKLAMPCRGLAQRRLPSPSQGRRPSLRSQPAARVPLALLGDTAAPAGKGATTTAGDAHRVGGSEGSGQHIEQRRRGREGSNVSFRSIPGQVSFRDGHDEW